MKLSVTLLLCVLIHHGLSAPPLPVQPPFEPHGPSDPPRSDRQRPPILLPPTRPPILLPPILPIQPPIRSPILPPILNQPSHQQAQPFRQNPDCKLLPILPSHQQGPHSRQNPDSLLHGHHPARHEQERPYSPSGPSRKRLPSGSQSGEQGSGLASHSGLPPKKPRNGNPSNPVQPERPQLAGSQHLPGLSSHQLSNQLPEGRYRNIAPAGPTPHPKWRAAVFGCSDPRCQGKEFDSPNAFGRHVTEHHTVEVEDCQHLVQCEYCPHKMEPKRASGHFKAKHFPMVRPPVEN